MLNSSKMKAVNKPYLPVFSLTDLLGSRKNPEVYKSGVHQGISPQLP
jgi:hypothetical protein